MVALEKYFELDPDVKAKFQEAKLKAPTKMEDNEMTTQTTIDNLKADFQEIEEEKRRIDEIHHAFMIVLRYFEEETLMCRATTQTWE